MRSLDVLFILPSLDRGGAERVTVNLANAAHRAGDRPRILLTDRVGPLAEQLDASIPVTRLGHRRVRSALLGIVRQVRQQPPDVVVSTHTHVNLALCAARSLLPARTGLVLREPIHAPRVLMGRSTRGRRVAQRVLYGRADLVLATSVPMLDDLRRLTGARVELLHNPVDVDGLRDDAARAAAVPGGAAPSGRHLISVSRLTVQKALPELLRAFASGGRPSDRLTLVGEGPLREELGALARALGVEDRVELAGSLDRPWEEVALADALVLASRDEGMPNAVLEALAVGTPVIASEELEVLRDLQRTAPEGALRLVPPELLADALRSLVARPEPRATRPTATLLPGEYTAEAVGERFRALLLEVLRLRPRRVTSGP